MLHVTKIESILSSGNKRYKNMQWGWEVFESSEKHCKTKYGYVAFPGVRDITRSPNDSMEGFFHGETLKYLYLLFAIYNVLRRFLARNPFSSHLL